MGVTSKIGLLHRRLVETVVKSGDLVSPEWKLAFQRVPRHPFVPRVFGCWPPTEEGQTDLIVDGESEPDRWVELVYSDRLLYITNQGQREASSSMPSVMARFLELLKAETGHGVLEIGTGSGYNAALLCDRLGSENVTSIDIDGELVAAAKARLSELGYAPTLAVANGWDGYPPRAPYDRIIATCSVPRIPEPWLEQLRPGGILVAPLRGGRFDAVGLAALHMRSDGSLVGRLHPKGAAFMRMREAKSPTDVRPLRDDWRRLANRTDGESRTCVIPPWLMGEEEAREPYFLLRLEETDWEWVWLPGPAGAPRAPAVVARADASWARVVAAPGGCVVLQGGPRRLWDRVEACYELWQSLGRPDMGRYGITVTSDRRQLIWLDAPDSGRVWELQ